MRRYYSRHRSSSRRFPRNVTRYITRYVTRYAIGMFTFAACLLVVCGVLLTYSLMTPATTSASAAKPLQASTATPTQTTVPTKVVSTATKTVQPTATVASTVSTTPTLVSSTPQTSQNGVFSLSSGGPLPVSESIFHPTNIARTTLNGTLISIYAGSLAADSQQGVLCVLRENLTTGQFSIQMYQSPHRNGPLTIVAIQNSTLKIVDSTAQGTFDLITNQFQW